MKVIGCQPNAPAAFTPRIILVLIFLEAASTPGHVELSDATEKTPATPGIDPGTFRLVALCLNHYATPDTGTARTIPEFLCCSLYCLFCVVLCIVCV